MPPQRLEGTFHPQKVPSKRKNPLILNRFSFNNKHLFGSDPAIADVFADAIIDLMALPQDALQALGIKAACRIHERFDLPRTVAQYEQVMGSGFPYVRGRKT